MDAGGDQHPDPRRPLLCFGIPYTTSGANEIVPYSRQELTLVSGAFRVTAIIKQVSYFLPLGARGLGTLMRYRSDDDVHSKKTEPDPSASG